MSTESEIKSAVESYIREEETRYAIMIDGDWGVGKTHFWENQLKHEVKNNMPEYEKLEPIYISLFGLKDRNEIESEAFKSMSSLGYFTEESAFVNRITNAINKVSARFEGVTLGGAGFIVQGALALYKEKKTENMKKGLWCLDDLERWEGDLSVCISYINMLVEHYNIKVIVIGNSRELINNNEDKEKVFREAKQKTIGFVYKLEHNSSKLLDEIFNWARNISIQSGALKILKDNKVKICQLLDEAKCYNIRIIRKAISNFSLIYNENEPIFTTSKYNSVDYFLSFLSLIILIEHFKLSDRCKAELLDPESNHKKFLKAYNSEKDKGLVIEPVGLGDMLVYIFDYGTNSKRKGQISMLELGFYRCEDFEEEFSDWQEENNINLYMDSITVYGMDDSQFEELYKAISRIVFEGQKVTNPDKLLVLSARILSDIDRGMVEGSINDTKDKIKKLFDTLYKNEKMEVVRDLYVERAKNSYKDINEICYYVEGLNNSYQKTVEARVELVNWGELGVSEGSIDILI